jgi:tetratricopeptide (TPR) repeat protein
LAIRQLRLGKAHTSSSDCLLNLGIIYKKLGFLNKSRETFEECISIRQLGGSESYQKLSHALEEYGKLQTQLMDFVGAF